MLKIAFFDIGTPFALCVAIPQWCECIDLWRTIKQEAEMAEKTEKKTSNIPVMSPAFDCLAVTNVQVFPFKEGANLGHMKGIATIVLNDQIQIRGLRVMDGENGMFVGYPLDTFYKGEDYRTVCLPITRQLREHIENCVLEKYQAAVA